MPVSSRKIELVVTLQVEQMHILDLVTIAKDENTTWITIIASFPIKNLASMHNNIFTHRGIGIAVGVLLHMVLPDWFSLKGGVWGTRLVYYS